MDEPKVKRLKTASPQPRSNVNLSYGLMKEKVGQCLTKEDVEALSTIAELTMSEKDQVTSHQGNGSRTLFDILEAKDIISKHEAGWLQRSLRVIGKEIAAKIVDDFICKMEELFELPSEPEYSDGEDTENNRNSLEFFLEKIGLKDKYPGKLNLNTFLKLRGKLEQDDIVQRFWQNLTSLNYNAGLPQGGVSQGYCMRDFIFCVLHCCNDFLRQDVLEKMSACQLAVPVVLQGVANSKPVFILWALRRIMKKWRGQFDSFAIEQSIVSYPVLNISFLRIGDVRLSKSQLMNTMLSCSQGYAPHTFFLNRDKDFVAPRFSSGSVECVWFLPMWESKKETFKEVIAFFNLRGDCSKHPVQTKFVCKAAHLTIALIAANNHKIHKECIRIVKKNSKSTIFISVSQDEPTVSTSQRVYLPKNKDGCLFVKVLQIDILSNKICEEIVGKLKNSRTAKTPLESLIHICSEEILIDEENEDCKNARLSVCKIFEEVEAVNKLDILDFKKNNFPLQSFWKEWVEIDKESLQMESEVHASFESQMESKKLRKRGKRTSQLQINLSSTMEGYLRIMKTAKSNSVFLQYIIGFMQEKIYDMVNANTMSDMNDIAELEREIRQTREQMMKGSCKNDNAGDSDARKSTIKTRNECSLEVKVDACRKLYKNCREKNFGGEHFLRELGQLYEAYMDLHETHISQPEAEHTSDIPLLPSLASRLVQEMHSLEIMEGDTGCIPLTWVTSVLDTLTRELNDPKVLVLSVIGVQSSGKSTLLNSMFGLRFPVRAGRCTRGLFIQLLKLEDEFSQELGFQYLIIVDSEGISSIDRDDRRFDNELVTLALSIADVTIFNIEGENIGPDLTSILQIAAHALIRMKEVDLTCHCRIVQQRVSDMTASDRNKANTEKLKEILDEVTRSAAEQEGLEGRYQQFSDVVDLQFDEDLQYMPCLWSGGMTPPNRMYSEMVTKIKGKLFEDIEKGNIVPELTLLTFTERVRDVWKAVKEEDFVFNFQDSVKAVDFNKFCLEYNAWILQMRQDVQTNVSKGLSLVKSVPEKESFEPNITTLKEALKTEIEEQRHKLHKCVEDYISRHPRKTTMLRHKREFLRDISVVLKEVEIHSLAKLTNDYEIRKIKLSLPHFQKKSRHILALEAKSEGRKYRDTSADLENDQFYKIWQNMMEKLKRENNVALVTLEPSSLQNFCEKMLLKITRDMAVGSEIQLLLAEEGGIIHHLSLEDCSKYISVKFVKSWLRHDYASKVSGNTPSQHCKFDWDTDASFPTVPCVPRFLFPEEFEQFEIDLDAALEELRDVKESMGYKRQQAVNYLKEVVEKNLDEMKYSVFDANTFQLMLQKTLKELYTKNDTLNIKLPHRLIAKGLLHFCGSAFVQIWNTDDNQIETLLDFTKRVVYEETMSFFRQPDQHKQAADFISYYAEKLFCNKIVCFCDSFYQNIDYQKYTERVLVPWDLLHFLTTSGNILEIGDVFNDRLFSVVEFYVESKVDDLMEEIDTDAKDKIESFILNLTSSIDQVQSQDTTWKEWSKNLGDVLGCPFIKEAGNIYHVTDVKQVSDQLQDNLRSILQRKYYDGYNELRHSLFKNAAGLSYVCPEVCPMCGAWCDNILESHTVHSSSMHRPRGLNGERYSSKGTSTKVSNDVISTHGGSEKNYLSKIVVENCNTSILSDTATFTKGRKTFLCKNYKDVFPNWNIHPGRDNQSGELFWRWNAAKFADSVFDTYEMFSDKIPPSWWEITKEQALQSLNEAKSVYLRGRQSMTSVSLRKGLLSSSSKDS